MSAPKTTPADPTAHAAAVDCSHTLLSVKFISVSSRLPVKEIRQFKETINKGALTVANKLTGICVHIRTSNSIETDRLVDGVRIGLQLFAICINTESVGRIYVLSQHK